MIKATNAAMAWLPALLRSRLVTVPKTAIVTKITADETKAAAMLAAVYIAEIKENSTP